MDVVVIGAGVIGLSVAWRAARAGLEVAVADPQPGMGASHVAAGMLAPVGEAHFGEDALLSLQRESATRYPGFVEELEQASGRSAGYRECGALLIATDADEHAELEREYRHRVQLGLVVRRLTSEECRDLEPGLAPGVRSGVLTDGDHQVDPRAMIPALLVACERAGVRLIRRRARLRVLARRLAGIDLDDGESVTAGRVVLAAGCWSAQVEGVPADARPPVRPVKGQILRLRGPAGLIGRSIRRGSTYVTPRGDGRVLIGATTEERGFDTSVTALAVYELLRDAREMIPDVAELELVEASAGLRPGSPDNLPMVGESSLAGLSVATGHHRNGFLLAPLTADLVVAALTGDRWPDLADRLSPQRFGHAATVTA